MLYSQPASLKVSYSTPIMVHTAVTVILEYFIKWTSQVDELINYVVVLSGTNNLKSVWFFKLVLRYDYSIVLYLFLACTMQ